MYACAEIYTQKENLAYTWCGYELGEKRKKKEL